jgi:hypothetical protein
MLSPSSVPGLVPGGFVDERPARRTLLDQIERLERELSSLFVSSWPRKGMEFAVAAPGGPRLLSLGELENVRDELARRIEHARGSLSHRTYVEEQYRRKIEEMLLAPEEHRWQRVSNEDIGEPGCKHWHVRPRWGVLGYLMNWWRVKISSGCPLPRGGGRRPSPAPRPPSRRRGQEEPQASRRARDGRDRHPQHARPARRRAPAACRGPAPRPAAGAARRTCR